MSDQERFVVAFVLTRTEGRRMPVDYLAPALEELLDGLTEVFVTDDTDHESEYAVEYLVLDDGVKP